MATSGKILIVSEKPSVARDLARVVGASAQGDGLLYGNDYTVTWAIGHLVTLPEPHQINPEWKAWNFTHLPMLPQKWPLIAVDKTRAQYEIVKKALSECDEVICATDAGREGELIFRYIYELAKCKKPVKRLWISSLTPEAIRGGLKLLKPAHLYDPLADAARARSRADWLFGMNLSRAYALTTNEQLFVGRVQTPTLAMIVDRDLKIQNFVPEDYFVIEGYFNLHSAPSGTYKGAYLGGKTEVKNPVTAKEKHLPVEPQKIEMILNRVRQSQAKIANVDGKTVKQPPPLLYDLTELQRHCNRLFGFSATQTLGIAQNLYERHKLISYPRTGSRHLSESVAETLPDIVKNIWPLYENIFSDPKGKNPLAAQSVPAPVGPLSSRFVDDSKVTDHHAIIPTTTPVAKARLSGEEHKVFDLICRRLLMAWQKDHVTAVTTLITEVGGLDLFKTQGTMIVEMGWKALDIQGRSKTPNPDLPVGLQTGAPVEIQKMESRKKSTEPPPHLTEATLLTGMETAGRHLEDRELAEFMQDAGLGTPATRAGIIETLLTRNYIERKEKSLVATLLGQRLIALVHPSVKTPELTARWEKKLGEIQNRECSLASFMVELETEVSARVSEIGQSAPPRRTTTEPRASFARDNGDDNIDSTPPFPLERFSSPTSSPSVTTQAIDSMLLKRSLTPIDQLQPLLKKHFGFDSFRASQEVVCRAVTEGKDVLLVMPTGAGKSICYQIPGIARGGTTLVVSPLVALIEDQVAKLQSLNFSAERIHSGRGREESRLVCQKYLAGTLDFLFIAPERLSVPGFPEFLKRRPPTLIAIDEAHCISQWGHDFRPDYRILGERLKELRPTPVIALTATATPTVQDDICRQLALTGGEKIIQGFRRTNISIEVAELSPSDRPQAIQSILKRSGRLPAIVYAPTRKKTDAITEILSGNLRVGSYHAGMSAAAREKVQTEFLANDLDVIVATVAFGMGIDKPNIRTVIHAAMPGSVEGYYQEIGRAGRDGLPSQAYLLHSFADQKTHEFFFDMNYPEITKLRLIFHELTAQKIAKDEIQHKLRHMELETFERALEQLWVHRGVIMDPDENMCLGQKNWEKSYQLQRDLKQKQLKQMSTFATSGKCRMVHLVSHFGDQKDSGKPCGTCDICNPNQTESLLQKRSLSPEEQKAVAAMFNSLESQSGLASGKLFQMLTDAKISIVRSDFERIVSLLERIGWLESTEASFEKEGQNITYRKLSVNRSVSRVTRQDIETLEIISTAPIEKRQKNKKTIRSPKAAKSGKSPFKTDARKRTASDTHFEDSRRSHSLYEPLREWRLKQARQKKIPAFRILTDKALLAICEKQPHSLTELLEISSIQRKAILQYGDDILRMTSQFGGN